MREAISNTSPLLYLYQIEALEWLSNLFGDVWVPNAVLDELEQGRHRGYDVPDPVGYEWLQVVEPNSVPEEWLTLDLGAGELATLALGLEHPNRVVLVDERLARRVAQSAGLTVWGTLKILLEAKSQGLTQRIAPLVDRLSDKGMWISDVIRQQVLALACEDDEWGQHDEESATH
ncbi:MAG: DUF3368 domain-containing protein [Gemmatimonadota bacterium]|nr:DUF3368 domain-containing protein [Gemmatimonadota bacterium]